MSGPPNPSDTRSILAAADAVLLPFHRERLERLGPDGSGLFAHYADMVGKGSLYRHTELERLHFILRRLPLYDHYVVGRAGLGELAFALALAGRRVTAWDPNDARRGAIEAGLAALAEAHPEARERITVAGRGPETIPVAPGETSLTLAFDFALPSTDDVSTTDEVVRTDAIIYEPRLFLRTRAEPEAPAEVEALLAAAGFDAFRMLLLNGVWFATRGPNQPQAEPVRFRPRPRAEPWPAGPCRGLIGLFGGSYCGSTLLTAMLGSHPRVGGGGELHWLTRKDSDRGVCAVCGPDCRVWTPVVRAEASVDNLYDLTALTLGKPVVCDASKMPLWFSDMLERHGSIPQTNVLVVKHPVRQTASFLHHARNREGMEGYRDPFEVLRQLAALYHRAIDLERVDLLVRYEDLVADPRREVTRILAHRGLDWSEAIDAWQAREHHHIGGNPGMTGQLDRRGGPRLAYNARKYEGGGLFLDDSYREVLDAATFRAVSEHPLCRDICEMFDYGPLSPP